MFLLFVFFVFCVFCVVSSCVYSYHCSIRVQVYRPVPPVGNTIAVNKYHIPYAFTWRGESCFDDPNSYTGGSVVARGVFFAERVERQKPD
jgi:hypothetical protein